MPWKNHSYQEQRWEFVRQVLSGNTTLIELCGALGISRKTAYKWLARFQSDGRRGLADRSRVPSRLHNRPSRKWLNRVRRAKARHPKWGGAKIRYLLSKRHGPNGVPSEAALGRWFKAWGLTGKRRKRAGKGPSISRPKLTRAQGPNEVWTVDFKGWFRTGDGRKVEPLTVRDLASRYVLAIGFMAQQNIQRTRVAFEGIFQKYGLPLVIRADNGSPFGSKGALGLTRLSAWWLKLGIRVEFIEPGHPEQNGGHEQFHRVYKAETLAVPAPTVRAQKGRSNRWRELYNQERPHEALGMEVPAKFYRRSPRKMPRKLKPWCYPGGWKSRLVKGHGVICFNGRDRYVGEAFEKERVGLKQDRSGVWLVYFGRHLIGELWDSDVQGMRAVNFRKKPRA